MNAPTSTRRNFLKTSALTGIGATVGTIAARGAQGGSPAPTTTPLPDLGRTEARAAGQKPVHNLVTPPRARMRVGVVGLHRGMSHVEDCLNIEFVDIIALCDLKRERAQAAADICEKKRGRRPDVYGGTEDIWEKMADREDIDVMYFATPWNWHVPMCLRAMDRGKHAFVEVPAAITLEDCWKLVDASERTQRHCVMLENCCYGENELFVLNMARQGVFGELVHAECAYIHDLRTVLFELDGEGDWRRDYHERLDGNLYPTHGLGPVAQYLGVGRGDQFKFLVSMSSAEGSLTAYRNQQQPNGGKHAHEKYVCGDMNTSLLKTELGRTIMLQHDVVSARPYNRINALSGTAATFFDYPARLAIDEPGRYGLTSKGSEEWLADADLAKMREKFTHPLWRKLAVRAKDAEHGGMDFVMNWRHLDCVRRGVTPDSVVYDAAAWSSIIEASTWSVAHGSMPVSIPDFTRGLWKSMRPLPVAEVAAG